MGMIDRLVIDACCEAVIEALVLKSSRAAMLVEGANGTGLSGVRVASVHRSRAGVIVGWHLAQTERDRVGSNGRARNDATAGSKGQPRERPSCGIAHIIEADK